MPHNIMQNMQVLSSSLFHAVTEIVVPISPNPADREVYKVGFAQGKELYGLAKIALEKLMIAAGIEEIKSESRVVQERVWRSIWTGKYVQPDGKEIPLSGEKEIDLRIGGTRWEQRMVKELDALLKADGIRAGAFVKAGYGCKVKGGGWVKDRDITEFSFTLSPERNEELQKMAEAQATRYVRQAAQFGLELAQTGARHRAIRAIMQIGQYTQAELKEPFIVIRSHFDMAAARETLGPVKYQKVLEAMAVQAFGLDAGFVQGLLSAPTPAETVEADSEMALNGDVPMEFDEFIEAVPESDAIGREVNESDPPRREPPAQDKAVSSPATQPVPVPQPEDKTSAFTQPIAPELAEWLKENYHSARFPNLGSLIGYATDRMVGVESLTHGEGCNLRRFVEELAARPDADGAETTKLKVNLKAIVLQHNKEQKLWIANEDHEQLTLPETEGESE